MVDIEYVELGMEHAKDIAAIHANSLTGDVLPALGYKFLTQYYQYVIEETEQLIIGALHHEQLVGFCQLSFSPITVTNIIYHNPLAIFYIVRLAIKDTRQLINGIHLALKRPEEILKLPEISFMAVRTDFQGKGVGKSLVKSVNAIATAKGKEQITTKTSNEIAKNMYEKVFNANIIKTKRVGKEKYWYLSWDTCKRH